MESHGLRLAYKVYQRPFRVPVRTSHGHWMARHGILLRLEDENGRCGFGEIAPLERFGTETLAGALAWCAGLSTHIDRARLKNVPAGLPCTAWALASALGALQAEIGSPIDRKLAVSALLPHGKLALEALERHAERGFACFKTKIGAEGFASEVQTIARIVDHLPPGARLRLDANGGLDARLAMRWLDVVADWPIEFIEQALPVEARRESIALAHDHSVPLAIDEAVRTGDDIKRWRDEGWPGIFVIKPALAGDPAAWLPEIAVDPGQFVFSSALETAIGTRAGVEQAMAAGVQRALGYGVGAFFEDDGLGAGLEIPEVTVEDLRRIGGDDIWRRL